MRSNVCIYKILAFGCLMAFASLVAPSMVIAQSETEDIVELEEKAMRQAAMNVAPSVVRIETFAGLERAEGLLAGSAPTTGLVVSADGFIISSAFNFLAKPDSILVTLGDGKRVTAKIAARDNSRQLVLLKVEATDLPVPKMLPRSEMQVGQWTVAIGRTFDATQPNLSVGILSATNRVWGKAIQTDAKISPNNYGGPMVDIYGRVLGILVPLSPQSDSEVAGAEWYDSGIGFAVPLEDVYSRLEQMKVGNDQHRGILGIALKGDMFATPEIAVVQPNSPSYDAGLKGGDIILQVNDQNVVLQTELKHALGPLYAGETVRLLVKRKQEEIPFEVELTDKLSPYEHPYLGVLPMRNEQDKFMVRHVFAESPAAKAGIEVGDQIIKFAEHEVEKIDDLREHIAARQPNEEVAVIVKRNGKEDNDKEENSKEETVIVELGRIPTEVAKELPAAAQFDGPAEGDPPNTGVVEVKLPEEAGKCFAYVPDNYDARKSYGLIVWIRSPGEQKKTDELKDLWSSIAASHDTIVLAPQSKDEERWLPTEEAFIRKTIDNVKRSYNIDNQRVITYGYQAGGAMAYLTAFAHRNAIRGVAAIDASVPVGIQPPQNSPVDRLAFYIAVAEESKQKRRIDLQIDKLKEAKFPIIQRDLGTTPRELDETERTELARWVDSLDGI